MVSKLHAVALMALAILSTIDAKALIVRTGPPKQPSCVDFTPFAYAGCFKDDSTPRTLLYSSGLDSKTMTVEKCVAFCKGRNIHLGLKMELMVEQEMSTNMLDSNTMVNVSWDSWVKYPFLGAT